MITEDKVTELFCMADDFCKFFDAMMENVVDEIKGNFFSCKMKEAILGKGNSGSPLLIDNNVIGVLHGGLEQTTICVFQKILPFMM